MTTHPHSPDEAMLAYLAGDDAAAIAAVRIRDAAGRFLAAQSHLESAAETYRTAIHDAGIPSEHAERLGAALILRLNSGRPLAELGGDRGPDCDSR